MAGLVSRVLVNIMPLGFNLLYYIKYFQKVLFCVTTHPIGQNGRAVCKT